MPAKRKFMMTAGLSRALGILTVALGLGIFALFIAFLYQFEIWGYYAFLPLRFAIYFGIWICYLAMAIYSSLKPISPRVREFLLVSAASISGIVLSLSANIVLPNLTHLFAICSSQQASMYLVCTLILLIAGGAVVSLRNRRLLIPAAAFVLFWFIAALPVLIVLASCYSF